MFVVPITIIMDNGFFSKFDMIPHIDLPLNLLTRELYLPQSSKYGAGRAKYENCVYAQKCRVTELASPEYLSLPNLASDYYPNEKLGTDLLLNNPCHQVSHCLSAFKESSLANSFQRIKDPMHVSLLLFEKPITA